MSILRSIHKFYISIRYAFRLHKPVLTLRLINILLDVHFFKKKPLRYVDFALGYKCNLTCQHCFATVLEDKNRKIMSPDDYKRVVKESMELGAVNFSIQGGEPLLYRNLRDIIQALKPEQNVISVTTNGVLLTAEKVKELKMWGVDILTVSLDSGIEDEHDDFRGKKGIFEKTLNGIKEALKQGLHVTIGTTVYHGNIKSEGIRKICDLAKDLKCVLCFNLAVPIGNWDKNEEVLLTENDLEYLKVIVNKSPYIRTDFEANIGGYGCGSVKEILYITPYGDVLPCPFIHISLGNVLNEPVKMIRERALKNKYFKSYYQTCLCATDKEFIKNCLSKTRGVSPLPIPAEEVFENE
ncbi:MAG: radical SAM protein [Candidatus Eremiobacterota bacterium]